MSIKIIRKIKDLLGVLEYNEYENILISTYIKFKILLNPYLILFRLYTIKNLILKFKNKFLS